jgi:SAM-dependent methyltransferase
LRDTTKALISHYVEQLDLSGHVLEIGGRELVSCAIDLFPEPRFAYHNLSPDPGDVPQTISADITDCRDLVADQSFDIVLCCEVLEQLDRPWLAAAEITRILRPGGLVVTSTLSAGGNHPGPGEHWSYLPESLELLFADLECLETGYDASDANRGGVYHVGRKGSPEHVEGGSGPAVPRFRDSDHPLAAQLSPDGAAAATDKAPPNDAGEALRPVLTEITDRLTELEKLVAERVSQLDTINSRSRRLERRIGQLDAIDARSRRLERRIDRAVASFPLRTMLQVRRWLHRILK